MAYTPVTPIPKGTRSGSPVPRILGDKSSIRMIFKTSGRLADTHKVWGASHALDGSLTLFHSRLQTSPHKGSRSTTAPAWVILVEYGIREERGG
ncbi:hypothetical protein KC973_00085 [Candidatus Saccharibacteria bacterium]|nr:hypothetical protein [Candidatus Saccharibacteria bacterium]